MVGVSAITLRSGESRHGEPSVREESQVSGFLISRLHGAAARVPSGMTGRQERGWEAGGQQAGGPTCRSGRGARSR